MNNKEILEECYSCKKPIYKGQPVDSVLDNGWLVRSLRYIHNTDDCNQHGRRPKEKSEDPKK